MFKMLTIPTIWFSFLAFIVATVCNGFLSVNLEPQVNILYLWINTIPAEVLENENSRGGGESPSKPMLV